VSEGHSYDFVKIWRVKLNGLDGWFFHHNWADFDQSELLNEIVANYNVVLVAAYR